MRVVLTLAALAMSACVRSPEDRRVLACERHAVGFVAQAECLRFRNEGMGK